MSDKSLLFGTEAANPAARRSHAMSDAELVRAMHDNDAQVTAAIAAALPAIAETIDETVSRLRLGGRLFYIGAGTSGRLGVLDASECPPTFSTDPSLVQGIIAGGDHALRHAVEGAEDDDAAGRDAIAHLKAHDVLICLSASGSAAFVRAAAAEAKHRGVFTAAICTAEDAPLLRLVDCPILAATGAEFVAGSTRLKSGTAQKMILNMISTGVMIRLGHVYGGYMINVKISNNKLRQRAIAMVAILTGCTETRAAELVSQIAQHSATPVKAAIVMQLQDCSYDDAITALDANYGRIDAIMQKHGRDKALSCA